MEHEMAPDAPPAIMEIQVLFIKKMINLELLNEIITIYLPYYRFFLSIEISWSYERRLN